MANGKTTWKYNKLLTARKNYYVWGSFMNRGSGINSPIPPIDSSLGGAQNPNSNPTISYNNGTEKKTSNTPKSSFNLAGWTGLASGVASSVGGMITDLEAKDVVSNTDNMIGSANQSMRSHTGGDSYDQLLSDMSTYNPLGKVTEESMGKKSGASIAGGALAGAASGAAAGAALGPWGAAAGAVVGAGASLIGSFGKNAKIKKETARLNKAREEANAFNERQFSNRAGNIGTNQIQNLEANYAAFGGPLDYSIGGSAMDFVAQDRYLTAKENLANRPNVGMSLPNYAPPKLPTFGFGGELNTQGSNFTNGLLYIENGGSHETNPYEGVPMGVDPEGVPNLVEEGETIFNDYVFSKRMAVPKAVRTKYKLREGGFLSFADASKKLAKESEERPNDPISQRGLEAMMSMLAQSQEEVRGIEKGGNMAAYGGNLFAGGGDKNVLQRAWNEVVDFSDNIATYVPLWLKKQKREIRRMRAEQHYNPTIFDDILGTSYRTNPLIPSPPQVHKEDFMTFEEERNNKSRGSRKKKAFGGNLFEKGSKMNRYYKYNKDTKIYDLIGGDDALRQIMNDGLVQKRSGANNNGGTDYFYGEQDKVEDIPDRGTWLRYAPAVGLGLASLTDAFGWTNKPDYTESDAVMEAARAAGQYTPVAFNPIGNYMTYRPFDRDYAINKLNAEAGASRRALLNTSGGNRATAMAGILAADNNYLNQLGELTRKAEEYNLAQRQQVEEFNRATNQANSAGFLQADTANQKAAQEARDAYFKGALSSSELRQKARMTSEAAKSANISGLFNALGDIGKENMAWKWRNFGLRTGTFGNISDEELERIRANGGKLKRKKKGLTC